VACSLVEQKLELAVFGEDGGVCAGVYRKEVVVGEHLIYQCFLISFGLGFEGCLVCE